MGIEAEAIPQGASPTPEDAFQLPPVEANPPFDLEALVESGRLWEACYEETSQLVSYQRAHLYLEEARRRNSPTLLAEVWEALGIAARLFRDHATMLRSAKEEANLRAQIRSTQNSPLSCRRHHGALRTLARYLFEAGALEEACRQGRKHALLARKDGLASWLISHLSDLGETCERLHRLHDAARVSRIALKIVPEIGWDRYLQGCCRMRLARICTLMGRFKEALEVEAGHEWEGFEHHWVDQLERWGHCYLGLGRLWESRTCFQEAAARLQREASFSLASPERQARLEQLRRHALGMTPARRTTFPAGPRHRYAC